MRGVQATDKRALLLRLGEPHKARERFRIDRLLVTKELIKRDDERRALRRCEHQLSVRELCIDTFEERLEERALTRRGVARRTRSDCLVALAAAAHEPRDTRCGGLADRAQIGDVGFGLGAQPLAHGPFGARDDTSERARAPVRVAHAAQACGESVRLSFGQAVSQRMTP